MPGRESRRSRRIKVNLSVIYQPTQPVGIRLLIKNKEVTASILDLSDSGISVLTNYDILVNTPLLIKFTLFSIENNDVCFSGPMKIEGVVRHNMPLGGNKYRLGIYFKKINSRDKTEIINFIKAQSSMFGPSI